MNTTPNIIVKEHPDQLHTTAAETLAAGVEQAAAAKRRFSLALAGGSTPKGLYRTLAAPAFAQRIPWSSVDIYFGDERTVAPDHEQSNYRMAREALLDHVPINQAQIHRMAGEHPDPQRAARDYATVLDQHLAKDSHGLPCFDLILLGLGPDGHIASLFPDTDILTVDDRTAAAVWVPQHDTWRLSLTYPVINHAKRVWLLVTGAAKADIVAQILDPSRPVTYPAQKLAPGGEYNWFLDAAAAAALPETEPRP